MKQLLKNIRLPWLLFTLLVFGGLVKLGVWQWHRALEKEARLEKITEYSQTKAMPLVDFLTFAKQHQYEPEQINDVEIQLNGQFNNEQVLLLDNQVNNGVLGYRVLQVLNTDEGAVLVNLGWVKGSVNRNELPTLSAINGEQKISGHSRIPEKGIVLAEQSYSVKSWPFRIQQIEIAKLSTLFHQTLLPFVVYLDKNETIGYVKNWQPIVMPPSKHRAYAFQWFSLSIAWLCLMAWAAYKNNKNI